MWTFNDQSIVKKNHMDILWHKYADKSEEKTIVDADLPAKASVVGRVGLMMLSCGTGAWRVRSSMNELSALLDMTCTVDIGLMSINYTCFDGNDAFSQSLCLTNTGVNTSKLNRLEKFVMHFKEREITKSCEEIHTILDKIEEIHGLYSPVTLAVAAALAYDSRRFHHYTEYETFQNEPVVFLPQPVVAVSARLHLTCQQIASAQLIPRPSPMQLHC